MNSGFAGCPVDGFKERMPLGEIAVDALDMTTILSAAQDSVTQHGQISIFAVNPEKVIRAESDNGLRNALLRSEFLIPDGIGAVFALRLEGYEVDRVPGSELMPALCQHAASRGWSVYLLGASEAVNQKAAQALQCDYPGLAIAGRQHGYFAEDSSKAIVEAINLAKPDILFVALGSPAQELWIDCWRHELDVRVLQGVGGTFDVLAGEVRRAPRVWRRWNLEWLYRLLSNPKRILRQRALPLFAWRLLRRRLSPASEREQQR